MKKWLCTASLFLTLTTACSSGGEGDAITADNKATEGEKSTVTLSIRQLTPFYQTLENKFEAKYPDIDLQIKAYKQIGEKFEPEDYEKYQKTTNTALLSGRARMSTKRTICRSRNTWTRSCS